MSAADLTALPVRPAPQSGGVPMTERMIMARDMATGTDLELPLSELLACDDRYRVLVWDEDAGEFATITRREAALSMFAYAERFRLGSPARAAVEERAIELAGDDLPWNRKLCPRREQAVLRRPGAPPAPDGGAR